MGKKIGINEVNFHGMSMDTETDRLTMTYDIVFGNVWDKQDIQWIREQLEKKLTLDAIINIMSKPLPVKFNPDGSIKK